MVKAWALNYDSLALSYQGALMKKLLITGLTLFSISAFSQSYMVLHSGVTLTTDRAGFIYDFNHFVIPYKVNVKGGQFLVEDEKLITIDEHGYLYRKTNEIKKVKGKGLNYFINDGKFAESNLLYTVDSKGFVYKWTKDAPDFKTADKFGGNFFVTTDQKKKQAELYTINSNGNYFKVNVAGLNPFDITTVGGTYFVAGGIVYTVTKDGFVYPKKEIKVEAIKKLGGNYFIDDSGKLFTVSEEGLLILPALPVNMQVRELKVFGTNFVIDTAGRTFTVDKTGNFFERIVEGHDMTSVKVVAD